MTMANTAMSVLTWLTGAVEIRRELCNHTSLDLPTTFVFDYPTADEMAAFILQELPISAAAAPVQPAAAVPPAQISNSSTHSQPVARQPAWRAMQAAERPAFVYQLVRAARQGLGDVASSQSASVRAATWTVLSLSQRSTTQMCLVQVTHSIKTILGSDVGSDAPLMSSGLDSLGAMELHRSLARYALVNSHGISRDPDATASGPCCCHFGHCVGNHMSLTGCALTALWSLTSQPPLFSTTHRPNPSLTLSSA